MPQAWTLWGMAIFSLAWAGSPWRAILALPFGMPHWGMSFPIAAVTALTLRLAVPGTAMATLGTALLAAASLLIAALALATWRGLRDGTLLVPETAPPVAPVP